METMRVTMRTVYAGPSGNCDVGREITLPMDEAQALRAGGYCDNAKGWTWPDAGSASRADDDTGQDPDDGAADETGEGQADDDTGEGQGGEGGTIELPEPSPGNWYVFPDGHKAHGKAKAEAYLANLNAKA